MKIRNKVKDLDAIQYNPDYNPGNPGQVVDFVAGEYTEMTITPQKITIQTAAARLTLLPGQYLVRGADDQLYVLPALTDYEIISNGQAQV